ncbi:MAG: hypothetical protein JNK78_14845 [Planctomycetes bacterium]|nr:hypothetical protein [Planctomycetota bacterium]
MIPRFLLPLALTFFPAFLVAQDKPAPEKPGAEKKEGQDKKDKEKSAAKVDFQKEVWPILEKRCVECHETPHTGPDGKMKKAKGGVVLDSKDGITTSKRGKLVVAKNAAGSMIYESISLPADDEDRMPPAKKGDPLAKEQIELIQRWIDQGADFGSWTGKAKATDKAGDKPTEGDKPKGKDGKESDKDKKAKDKPKEKENTQALLEAGLKALPATTLAALQGGPFSVASIGDNSPLLEVTCVGRTDDVDDAALAALAPLAEHVTSLDLGHSRVTDEACTVIARMSRLTTLDLRQTAVGNHGVAALAACSQLRSLNLFGTKAGDYGIAALSSTKKLENLYLWQTDVSPGAVVRLRESLPETRIVVAAELPEPMAEGAGGNGRRRGAK